MFTTINEGVVALRSKTLTELKPETEISLEGTFSKGNPVVLDVALDAWLIKETRAPKVLLLQGTAGSGKTQFCQKLTIRLWEKYSVDDNPIPLYIALANLKNPTTRAIEETLENIGFNQEQIIILKEKHHFIFILDGYDELYEFINLHLSNRLGEWRAQTIITCRSEALYFIYDYEKYFVPFKANRRLAIGLQQIEIKPLSALQIKEFLSTHLKDNLNGITYAEVTIIPGLLSLIQTPLLLKAILPVQKYLLVSPKDFYDTLIETRFLWQEQKLKFNKLIDRATDFKPYFWSYCKNLALFMQEHETSIITYKQTRGSLFESSFEENIWEKFLKGDNKIQWMYSVCLLVRNSNGSVGFIDNCLIDYFATQIKFYEELELFSYSPLAATQEQKEVQEIERLNIPLIGRKLFTNQEEKLRLLADIVVENDSFTASLFNYIERSKTDKRYAVAASNSISGLNFAKIPFSGLDLCNIQIPGANLEYAIFSCTQLQMADLSNVSFKGAFLNEANMEGSNLQGAQFGEIPYLSFKHYKSTTFQGFCVRNAYGYRNILGPKPVISKILFSVDDTYIIIAVSNCIEIWDYLEKKQIAKLCGHSEKVTSIALSLDGKLLASGSIDGSIKLWNLNSYSIIQTLGNNVKDSLTDHERTIRDKILFSLKSGGDGVITDDGFGRYDLAKIISSIQNPIELKEEVVSSICISLDKLYLFAGSKEDSNIKVWDLTTYSNIKILEGHTSGISSLIILTNSACLISGSLDSTIKIWDLNTYELIQTLEDQDDIRSSNQLHGILALNSFADGRYLISASYDNTIKIWDLNTYEMTQILMGHGDEVVSLVISPYGPYLVSAGNDNIILIWDLNTYKNILSLDGPRFADFILCIDISKDGKYLAIVSDNDNETINIVALELSKYKHIQEPNMHIGPVYTVSLLPSNRYLISGGWDHNLHIWDLENSTPLGTILGHSERICSTVISSDGNYLISASRDAMNGNGTIKIWNLSTKTNIFTIREYTESICLSKNGKWLFVGSKDSVKLWELSSDDYVPYYIKTFKVGDNHDLVKNLCLSLDDQCLFVTYNDTIKILYLNTDDHMVTMECSNINNMFISLDGLYLFSGESKNINIWELNNYKMIRIFEGHTGKISSLSQSHNLSYLASGSWDCTIKLWNLDTYDLIQTIEGHTRQITSLVFSKDSKRLISSSDDSSIMVWNLNKNVQNNPTALLYARIDRLTKLSCDNLWIHQVQNMSDQNRELLLQKNAKELLTVKDEQRINTSESSSSISDSLAVKTIQLAKEKMEKLFYAAAEEGNTETIESILLSNIIDVDCNDCDGITPLYIAAENGHIEVVEQLLRANANVNMVTIHGKTPLLIADLQGYNDIITILLEAGARWDEVERCRSRTLRELCGDSSDSSSNNSDLITTSGFKHMPQF